MLRLALLLACLALPVRAEEVVAGLSQSRISITANFDGSEILVFGAVKRQEPIIEEPPLEVVITVSGPSRPVTVRRKSRTALIWVNTEFVEVDAAPSFYAVATSGPIEEVLRHTDDLRHAITVPRAIRAVGAQVEDPTRFTEALIRIRSGQGLYQFNEGTVDVTEQTLFDTSVVLPANLVEGNYDVRIFLTREGHVVSDYSTAIFVQKVGLERFLFVLAHERPLAYGILSLVIAIAAGWGASAAFRYLRT
ncbi:TIGR02186 family protein [Tranquillimonas alkanivorans]|uniref:Transmembrane protein (Alph_Pro_TM) n=1 Tax=Tranquillimonas alkanivorans TaxID=441119 RepID=A0A1I5PQE2_9RHOB|nr:TIGR02186 family protein [Tranquillimonas alkanivorans]SFP36235.1 conserved hypothetical protein [Tranquillimonas alkanivorans]